MFDWFAKLAKRAFSIQQLRTLIYGPPTIAGVAISEEQAVGLSAVQRALTLISGTIAGLDAEVYRDIPGRGRITQRNHVVRNLLHLPNDHVNPYMFWSTFILHAQASGNGYAEIERATNNMPIALHNVHWRNVRIDRGLDGSIWYHLVREDKKIPARDMIHLRSTISWDGVTGISPIRAARESLGIAVAAERYAGSVYGNGATPRGFLKLKSGGKMNPDTKNDVREAWEIIHGGPANSNKVGILGPDVEWVETNMTPEDAALVQTRSFQIAEISRIYGVPENMLFSGSQSYNSNEENNQQFYESSLKNILENLESELDHKLMPLGDRLKGYFIKYDVHKLNKGNFDKTVNAWSRLVLTGLATQNEGRAAIGLNPLPGGDVLYMPVNMAISQDANGNDVFKPLDQLPAPQQKALPAPTPQPEPVQAQKLDEDTLETVRAAFLDQVARSLRRQQNGGKNQRAHIIEALGPIHRAYMQVIGSTESIEAFADRWMERTEGKNLAYITTEQLMEGN